jgi:hypothetical protein
MLSYHQSLDPCEADVYIIVHMIITTTIICLFHIHIRSKVHKSDGHFLNDQSCGEAFEVHKKLIVPQSSCAILIQRAVK